jgi:hypothetical protein
MDRKPCPPPFPIDARVKYSGDTTYSRGKRPLLAPGDIGIVVEVVTGRRGTLDVIGQDAEGDDILDKSTDGRSVVRFPSGWTRSVGHGSARYELA